MVQFAFKLSLLIPDSMNLLGKNWLLVVRFPLAKQRWAKIGQMYT